VEHCLEDSERSGEHPQREGDKIADCFLPQVWKPGDRTSFVRLGVVGHVETIAGSGADIGCHTDRVESRQVAIDGIQFHYRLLGEGPPTVLVHGLSGSWRWWWPVSEALAKRRSVYVLDLPRLGRRVRASELVVWLGRWLRAVGLKEVDLVGHSLGGLVAAELAATRPQGLRRLALVAPAGIPCGRGLFGQSLRLVATLVELREQFPTIVGDALRSGPLDIMRGAVFVADRDLRAELAAVRAPSLLVWGEHDRLVPRRIAEEWQQALPGSRLVLLSCGHVPMWEVPDELAACLLEFLEQQLADESPDEVRPRVVDGVRLAGNNHGPRPGQ
jgi:pimeloyl-ACP methyl ester carboxylesterase